jgi:mono/diheme cytochrome c family protein
MTAGKTTAQVFGLFGLLATAISLGFTAADVAAQEVAPKVMTAGEAVYTENCAHCHKATGQRDGGAAPALGQERTSFRFRNALKADAKSAHQQMT